MRVLYAREMAGMLVLLAYDVRNSGRMFQRYADRVYSLTPTKDGAVRVELVTDEPQTRDNT